MRVLLTRQNEMPVNPKKDFIFPYFRCRIGRSVKRHGSASVLPPKIPHQVNKGVTVAVVKVICAFTSINDGVKKQYSPDCNPRGRLLKR